MKKFNKKSPILTYIGLFLLAAVLISSYMVSGLYAKFISTSSGSDSARVAKFDVSSNIDSQEVNIELNFYDADKLTDSFKFYVTSNSEVSLTYDVVVTLPTGNYDWLDLTLDGDVADNQADGVFTFDSVSGFDVATNTDKTHTLTFAVNNSYIGHTGGVSDILGKATVTVHVEQVD